MAILKTVSEKIILINISWLIRKSLDSIFVRNFKRNIVINLRQVLYKSTKDFNSKFWYKHLIVKIEQKKTVMQYLDFKSSGCSCPACVPDLLGHLTIN